LVRKNILKTLKAQFLGFSFVVKFITYTLFNILILIFDYFILLQF